MCRLQTQKHADAGDAYSWKTVSYLRPQLKSLRLALCIFKARGNFTRNHNAADNLNYHFGACGGFPKRVFDSSEVMVRFVDLPVCKNYTNGCGRREYARVEF